MEDGEAKLILIAQGGRPGSFVAGAGAGCRAPYDVNFARAARMPWFTREGASGELRAEL